jgi:hypothetical protein
LFTGRSEIWQTTCASLSVSHLLLACTVCQRLATACCTQNALQVVLRVGLCSSSIMQLHALRAVSGALQLMPFGPACTC